MSEMIRPFTRIKPENQDSLKVKKDRGDEYRYLVLFVGEYKERDGDAYKTFEIINGRQATYDYIRTILINGLDSDVDTIIDVSKSHIIPEAPADIIDQTPRITLGNMITIYAFMKAMAADHLVEEDGSFNIDDYYDGAIEDNYED